MPDSDSLRACHRKNLSVNIVHFVTLLDLAGVARRTLHRISGVMVETGCLSALGAEVDCSTRK